MFKIKMILIFYLYFILLYWLKPLSLDPQLKIRNWPMVGVRDPLPLKFIRHLMFSLCSSADRGISVVKERELRLHSPEAVRF